MSPLNINILLHYHYSPRDYKECVEPAHGASCAVYECLQWFVGEGLLTCRFGDVAYAASRSAGSFRPEDYPLFKITDKGTAMVEALMAVQIPICKWVQP